MIDWFIVIIVCGLAVYFVAYYYLQCDKYKYRLHKEIEKNRRMQYILQTLLEEDVKLLNREGYNIIISKNDINNNIIDFGDNL